MKWNGHCFWREEISKVRRYYSIPNGELKSMEQVHIFYSRSGKQSLCFPLEGGTQSEHLPPDSMDNLPDNYMVSEQ